MNKTKSVAVNQWRWSLLVMQSALGSAVVLLIPSLGTTVNLARLKALAEKFSKEDQ